METLSTAEEHVYWSNRLRSLNSESLDVLEYLQEKYQVKPIYSYRSYVRCLIDFSGIYTFVKGASDSIVCSAYPLRVTSVIVNGEDVYLISIWYSKSLYVNKLDFVHDDKFIWYYQWAGGEKVQRHISGGGKQKGVKQILMITDEDKQMVIDLLSRTKESVEAYRDLVELCQPKCSQEIKTRLIRYLTRWIKRIDKIKM
jgi:hypothetical protein